MHSVQLNSQYYEPHTSSSNGWKPARRTPRSRKIEGEKAMKTMTVMMEWSAVAFALYATMAIVLPVEGLAAAIA